MLDPADYLQDVSANRDRSACQLLIKANSYDFFIMGIPILKGYYSTHDMSKRTISFIPIANGQKPFLRKYMLPTKTLDKQDIDYYTRVIPVILLVLCAVPILLIAYPWISSKYSIKDYQFWLFAVGIVFGLMILYFGVFMNLIDYVTNGQSEI